MNTVLRLNFAAMLALLIPSLPAGAGEVPAAIAAPGETLIATAQAVGAQVYECRPDAAGRLTWQFREPIATLLIGGKTVGRHYAGPTWQMADGSAIDAKASGRVSGASASDIPLLKLDVVARRGAGQLAGVSTIQRLNTRGGAAEGACASAAMLLSVPYTADYAFYSKSEAH
jgi:hypothetical protein